jgi:Peptidase_C39 like family
MSHLRIFTCGLIAVVLVALLATPASAKGSVYLTGFTRWRAADAGFAAWQRSGVSLAADGSLQFDLQTAQAGSDPYPAGGYNGRNFYNGGNFLVGEALGPVVTSPFAFKEAIASWNAVTPAGSWIETQIRAQLAGRWTKWYNLGIWAADDSTIERHSVNLQGDGDGFVAVDTLVLTDKKIAASAYQLKVRLFSETGAAIPSVHNMSVAISTTPAKTSALTPGDPSKWNQALPVPTCSQMVYLDGGEVWCSPTSTSMVLGYWSHDTGPCAPRVSAAVEGVFDWIYDGHGNWPFNTAYAATQGLEGYVRRFTSMAQAEKWIAAGVPVIISYAWKKSTLDGAPIPSSNGHLAVLVGFDGAGNPVVNDPAAPGDDSVQRVYDRAQLETQWLETSGGTVYLIYPPGWAIPTP